MPTLIFKGLGWGEGGGGKRPIHSSFFTFMLALNSVLMPGTSENRRHSMSVATSN
jgi:hypothetical protein